MTGEDIDIKLINKGIRVVVNPSGNIAARKPNFIQNSAADLLNELNAIRHDIQRRTRRGIILTRLLQKKIGRKLPNL